MKQILKTIIFTVACMGLALLVFPVAAQIAPVTGADCGAVGIRCSGSENTASVIAYAKGIINVFLALVAIVAVIFIIYAGVHLVTSQGDEKKMEEAKRIILYAVVGLIVIGLAAAMVNFTVGAIQGKK